MEPKEKNKNRQWERIKVFVGENYLYIILILMFFLSGMLSDKFLTKQNIINIMTQNAVICIIALGMLYVIITGGIDLSVGSLMAFSVCLTSGMLNQGVPIPGVIFIVIAVMVLVGSISGALVAFGKIEPFIATLAMQTVMRGLAYMYQVGSVSVISNDIFLEAFGGNAGIIPVAVIYMLVIGLILHFVLKNTVFGRKIYAIGGNKEAASLVGISVKKTLISVYIISALLSGIAGVLMSARLRVGTALVGEGTELDAIASVVIGGAAFTGGKGKVLNTLVGAFILGIIGNIMNLMGVATYPQMMIKGVIIVLAVLANREQGGKNG